jgi:hypothetical protein
MNSSNPQPPGDAHARTQELLPWLLTGTLEGRELEQVQEHLLVCASCRADLARESRLRAAAPQDAPPLDASAAFARLQPRLGPQETPGTANASAGWDPRPSANDSRWLHALAAGQFGVIVVLALLALPPGREPDYRALGAATGPQGSLVATFQPDTPERELRRVLQGCGVRVVDGPTVTDAWQLQVAGPRAQGALQCLRAAPAVTLVQPLTLENRP